MECLYLLVASCASRVARSKSFSPLYFSLFSSLINAILWRQSLKMNKNRSRRPITCSVVTEEPTNTIVSIMSSLSSSCSSFGTFFWRNVFSAEGRCFNCSFDGRLSRAEIDAKPEAIACPLILCTCYICL